MPDLGTIVLLIVFLLAGYYYYKTHQRKTWQGCTYNWQCTPPNQCRDSGGVGGYRCLTLQQCQWAAGHDKTHMVNNCAAK